MAGVFIGQQFIEEPLAALRRASLEVAFALPDATQFAVGGIAKPFGSALVGFDFRHDETITPYKQMALLLRAATIGKLACEVRPPLLAFAQRGHDHEKTSAFHIGFDFDFANIR